MTTMKKLLYILSAMAALALAGCTKEVKLIPDDRGGTDGETAMVKITAVVPSNGPETRAGTITDPCEDNIITNLFVMQLAESPIGSGQYVYIKGMVVPPFEEADGDVSVTVPLIKWYNKSKILAVANYTDFLVENLPAEGISETALRTALAGLYNGAPYDSLADVKALRGVTMAGEKETSNVIAAPGLVIEIPMVRMEARVDIDKNLVPASKPFVVTGAYLCHPTDHAQIFPNLSALDPSDHTKVLSPSVPAGSNPNSVYLLPLEIEDDGANLTLSALKTPYLPEARAATTHDERIAASCVVIGGRFDTDAEETFYRVDFNQDDPEKFGEILRNHRYVFNVTEVTRRGAQTVQDAIENIDKMAMVVDLKSWDMADSDIYLGESSGQFVKIERWNVFMKSAAGITETSDVMTNVPLVYRYFEVKNGIETEILNTSTYEYFDIAVTGEPIHGAPYSLRFSVTTKKRNDGSDPAGWPIIRIKLYWTDVDLTNFDQLTFVQNGPQLVTGKIVNVLSVGDEGALGDNTTTDYNELRIMLGTASNFGTGGTVKIGGFNFESDVLGTMFTNEANVDALRAELEQTDILVMGYGVNPAQANSEAIVEWLADPSHVIFVSSETSGLFPVEPTNLLLRDELYAHTGYTLAWEAPVLNMVSEYIFTETINDANRPFLQNAAMFGSVSNLNTTFTGKDATMSFVKSLPAQVTPLVYTHVFDLFGDGRTDEMVMGVDKPNRIVWIGDSDLVSEPAVTNSEFRKAMLNVWAWAATTAASE